MQALAHAGAFANNAYIHTSLQQYSFYLFFHVCLLNSSKDPDPHPKKPDPSGESQGDVPTPEVRQGVQPAEDQRASLLSALCWGNLQTRRGNNITHQLFNSFKFTTNSNLKPWSSFYSQINFHFWPKCWMINYSDLLLLLFPFCCWHCFASSKPQANLIQVWGLPCIPYGY